MEDYSINSSIHKSVVDVDDDGGVEEEESGWTAYFEDFSNMNNGYDDDQQQKSWCNNSIDDDRVSCSSSLISDAATTGAAWRFPHRQNPQVFASAAAPKKPLRFKKTRAEEIFDEDDSLEDTASSPLHSPKVSDWKSNEMNIGKREDQTHSSQLGKETASSSEDYIEMDEYHQNIEEGSKRDFDNRNKNKKKKKKNNDCTELKQRGVCLVPLSMLVNYLG